MTTIVAICNQKGGVGKTTTVFHLARAAVRKGERVLVIDADPQGNATSVLTAAEVEEDQVGLADVLNPREQLAMSDVTVPGVWDGLEVVPTSGEALAVTRDELVAAGTGREVRLKKALAVVQGDYDTVLIDCAPSLDQLTANTLTAAGRVVVVTHLGLFSSNGLSALLRTVETVREYFNPGLRIAGILVNHYEANTLTTETREKELIEATAGLGLSIFQPYVPKRALIVRSTESSTGLDEMGAAGVPLVQIYDTLLTHIEGALS